MTWDANELITQKHTRSWYQAGGAGQRRYFAGLDTEYHFINSASLIVNGDISPIYVPDPRRSGSYRLVARTIPAPDLPEMEIVWHEKWGGIPRVLMAPKCTFTMYEVHSDCGDLSDFYRGWRDYVMVYSGFQFVGAVDLGTRTARDSDDPLADTTSAKGVAIYPVGALSFGEEAASDVVVEVIDAVYGTQIQCASCGIANDGSGTIYALTRANVGSPGAPGQLIYSTDGGATWTTGTITGIGFNEPRYLDIAGGVLLVGTAGTGLLISTINDLTGAPGSWSSVTLPEACNDVYVASASAIFFCADGGEIYKTTDVGSAPTLLSDSGSTNLNRIHGSGQTIVAVGESGLVYYSVNGGTTWATATAPAAAGLDALWVIDDYNWLVGSDAGNLYRTRNQGQTWETLSGFAGAGTGAIWDIIAPTAEIIWVSQAISSTAYLLTSIDGGNSWVRSDGGSSRILNWPTFQRARRLAAPVTADAAVAANYLTVCGLSASSTDGLLLAAAPTLI